MMNPLTKFKNWRMRRRNYKADLIERDRLLTEIGREETGQQASAAFAYFIDDSPQSMRRVHRKIRDHDENIRFYRNEIAKINKRINEYER